VKKLNSNALVTTKNIIFDSLTCVLNLCL